MPNACFRLLKRKEEVRDAGALLMEGLDAEVVGWSFHRFDIDGNLRLIRDASDSLLRSLESRRLKDDCVERS